MPVHCARVMINIIVTAEKTQQTVHLNVLTRERVSASRVHSFTRFAAGVLHEGAGIRSP